MPKKPKTWSDPLTAIASTSCRAAVGPDGSWADAAVCAPYTIKASTHGGWEVVGRINGCDWYITRAIDDAIAAPSFRTWRDALAACRRLYPGAEVWLRRSDRSEVLMDNASDYAWRVGSGRGDDLYARPMVTGRN